MADKSIVIGPYRQGEKPEGFRWTFLKADGTRDPLTGGVWVARLEYRRWNTPTPVTEVVATVDADQVNNAGDVTWTWVAADMAVVGDFEGEIWAGNGTNRFRNQRLRWVVQPSIQVPVI